MRLFLHLPLQRYEVTQYQPAPNLTENAVRTPHNHSVNKGYGVVI